MGESEPAGRVSADRAEWSNHTMTQQVWQSGHAMLKPRQTAVWGLALTAWERWREHGVDSDWSHWSQVTTEAEAAHTGAEAFLVQTHKAEMHSVSHRLPYRTI